MPKPVQQPHPELMVGGGGERVTLRIAAKHADHWNVWGGPDILARKSKILDDHCTVVGRDPRTLLRSANMPVAISDDRREVDEIRTQFMRRMGRDETAARDTVLGGSLAEVQDKLGRMQELGVGMLFVPTFLLGKNPLGMLDRFISEVAPAFRDPAQVR